LNLVLSEGRIVVHVIGFKFLVEFASASWVSRLFFAFIHDFENRRNR